MIIALRRAARASAVALALLAAAAGSAAGARILLAGAVDTVAVAPGDTITLDLVARNAGPSFNAFDLDVRFDAAHLTNLLMSPFSAQRGALMTSACPTNSPFHLFTTAPDSLVCTLVIMCNGVSVTGPGTLYRVRFIAGSADAWTTVSFGSGTTFYMGGPQVDTLVTRPIVVKIGAPVVLDAGVPRLPRAPELDPVAPNPGRGTGMLGVSFRLPRADDAGVTLLDAQGRLVAAAAPRAYAAGAQRASLALPRLAPGRYTVVLRTRSGGTVTRPWVALR